MALTKQAFEYWNNLKKVTENVGSLFDPQPVTFSGNIHSTSDDKEIVLGFVSAADKKEKRIFITTEEVGFIKVYTGYEGCDLDTVPSKSKLTIEAGDEPVTETSGPGGGSLLLVGAYSCIDCRARGTIQKPGFWED
jgi:hypothetical protein